PSRGAALGAAGSDTIHAKRPVHRHEAALELPSAIGLPQRTVILAGGQKLGLPVPSHEIEEIADRMRMIAFDVDREIRHDVTELRAALPFQARRARSKVPHARVTREVAQYRTFQRRILAAALDDGLD